MTEETRLLLEKAEKYVHSAELLRLNNDFDSAASRLYYAMFYCTEALLLRLDLTFSSHRNVHGAFAQHFVKTGILPAEMHEWLRNAFDKRQIGDYESTSGLTGEDVEALQGKAMEFIARAKRWLENPPR